MGVYTCCQTPHFCMCNSNPPPFNSLQLQFGGRGGVAVTHTPGSRTVPYMVDKPSASLESDRFMQHPNPLGKPILFLIGCYIILPVSLELRSESMIGLGLINMLSASLRPARIQDLGDPIQGVDGR